MSLRAVKSALRRRDDANQALQAALQPLSGQERRAALRLAIDAGIPASELASMLGVSRQYIHREASQHQPSAST